jgi:hypothetical protein
VKIDKTFYMKKYISILFILAICFFIPAVAPGQVPKIISDLQVKKAIETFAKLIDTPDLYKCGVKSLAELKLLKPGQQFKKYMISLDAIKKYRQGDDVNNMIKEYEAVEVALVNDSGKIKTSIEFVKTGNNWKASGYGSTSEFVILSQAQTALTANAINRGKLIRIPSLQVSFIAVSSAAGLDFVSLADNPKLKLTKGQTIKSSDAILKLAPYATKHNGSPN